MNEIIFQRVAIALGSFTIFVGSAGIYYGIKYIKGDVPQEKAE